MSKKAAVILTIFSVFFVAEAFVLVLWQKNNRTKQNNLPVSSCSIRPEPTAVEINTPPFTLRTIFADDHSWVETLPSEDTVTIITTGDVIPARTVNYKMVTYNDFTRPFAKTAGFLQKADLTLINLEAPLIKDCPITNEGMIFCGDQRFLQGLEYADIDVVNLANNHTYNYGIDGIKQTVSLLENNQIAHCGSSLDDLTIKQVNSTKIGFLGYNLLPDFDQKELFDQISSADKKVDILVVSLHWGAEYTHFPTSQQQTLAHRIIDEGADLIVGNHAHWIQPLEIYNNKLIVYAHGNFIFDQEWSENTKTGFVVKHIFYQKWQIDAQVTPIYITDYNQPDILTGTKKQTTLNSLEKISYDFSRNNNQNSAD